MSYLFVILYPFVILSEAKDLYLVILYLFVNMHLFVMPLFVILSEAKDLYRPEP